MVVVKEQGGCGSTSPLHENTLRGDHLEDGFDVFVAVHADEIVGEGRMWAGKVVVEVKTQTQT